MNRKTIKQLKEQYLLGYILDFDTSEHSRIPNTVLKNGAVFGTATITTINSYLKWVNNKSK